MTNNITGKYILEKNTLQTSIFWYEKTIEEVEHQQSERKERLAELKEMLRNLEQQFINNK